MTKFLPYILIFFVLSVCDNVYSQNDRQLIRNGNRWFHQQNYAKAEVEYRKALDKNSNNAQAMYNLGCALMQQQKDSVAVRLFQNAGKIETGKNRKAMVYHNIGVVCQKHQMYSEAIEAYKESLKNNPNDDQTRYNLALCKKLLKNQKQNQNQNKRNKDKQQSKQENQKQDKNKEDRQQQPKEQMSKDNAEQLLNAAMQEEKATQQRLKQAMQRPPSRHLQKNW